MEYYLGLDMGTNSVGWAVTDRQYHILRAKGKDLWGIREFDEACSAEDRRATRTSRRRWQREKARIGLLQDYFKDEIDKVDPSFYQRLDNSFFKIEDKDSEVQYRNILFNDQNFTDADYNRQYPTVFHLRCELIKDPSPHDVRLVYLAALNIFKHRGNFLNPSLSVSGTQIDLTETYSVFRNMLNTYTEIQFPNAFDETLFRSIMCSRRIGRTQRFEALKQFFGVEKAEKQKLEILRALAGLKSSAAKLFSIETEEKLEFCFSDAGYDEKLSELEAAIGDDDSSILGSMKQIFDACAWDTIMDGYQYLSEARIASYDKHKKDLKVLKSVFRKYKTPEDYDRFFRSDADGSYGDYVGSYNSGEKHRRRGSKHTAEDFYSAVKKVLKDCSQDDENVRYILSEIELGTFMPKQLTASNGIIPFQAHYKELKAILENASGYLQFLNNINPESGLTKKEEILRIFSFKIPYYIGPLTEQSKKNGGNGWVIRKEAGPVRPWNLDKKVDIAATSEEFIQRMVRRCTYMAGEKVLPKASLAYERFSLLNELNNIRIDGERLDTSLKQEIYEELFLGGKGVTRKRLASYLAGRGLIENENQISGIDERIHGQLASYCRFYNIFGDELKKDSCREMVEDIIYLSTIFGDEKKFLREKLNKKYGDRLDRNTMKRILALKFTDWGKLSRAFLNLQGVQHGANECMTLSEALWRTPYNIMELINSDEFSFKENLSREINNQLGVLQDVTFDDLDEMYFSAPVKRMVWQTLLVMKELEKVLGAAPSRVFVEFTREHQESKRTVSRKQQFLKLFQGSEFEQEWKDLIERSEENGTIRSKKMYLYLHQKGIDLYTGQPIALEDLFDSGRYDIDHIYPQSLTKDDNLDNNMVLTDKTVNNRKQDNYPLPGEMRRKMQGLWFSLHQSHFINDEKYKRLTGTEPLTDDQLAGFIARQLVETSQGTKAVADILKCVLPADSKVIYSKAHTVSDFRNQYGLVKSRAVNDLHHAHDAYLNIVVGNSYYVKFTDSPYRYIKERYSKGRDRYNLPRLFETDISNGKETAWIGSGKQNGNSENMKPEKGTIVTVRKMLSRPSPLMTRLTFTGHGGLTNQTIYSAEKSKPQIYLPLKGTDARYDVTKYGGVTSASTAYFILVESVKGKKKIRTLEAIPIYVASQVEKDSSVLEKYCKDFLKIEKPVIVLRKIKLQSLVKWNGYFLNINGKYDDSRISVRNATQMLLSQESVKYIKKLEKYSEKRELDTAITEEHNLELYDELTMKHTDGIFSRRPNPIGDVLTKDRPVFEALSVTDQITALLEIIKTTAIVVGGQADLTLIGEKKGSGRMKIPKTISSASEMKLYYQSITGLFCEVVDLLKI